MDISHLRNKFIDEANDLLSGLDADLLELESNPQSCHHINQVFRTMHTIKGASGMYGFNKITEITHEIETLFDLVRENKLNVSKNLIDLTLSTADHIRNLLTDFDFKINENIKSHTEVLSFISQFKSQVGVTQGIAKVVKQKQSCNGVKTWQIVLVPDEKLIFRGVNLSLIIGDLNELGKCIIHSNYDGDVITSWNIFLVTDKGLEAIEDVLVFISEYCKIQRVADFNIFDEQQLDENETEINKTGEVDWENVQPATSESASPQMANFQFSNNGGIKTKMQASHRIYVDSSKLDTLMYLVTELVTSKSELLLAIEKNANVKVLETAEKIDKLSKLFSENALSIRLVSLHEMLVKYQRLVRDLSGKLGKKVNFSIKGEHVELDKNMVDVIAEPIMHLIRNCMDHGIESPENRKQSNKDETGLVFFNAYESGNNVFIQIGDDGTGINPDYVYKKASEMGFINPNKQYTNKEILELIFLPGFSTAQSLTDVSGRGVGMDIVLQKIHEIRGEVFIDSQMGKGTTFTIKLQQTISIIDTLLIRSCNSVFAIPVGEVEACEIEEHAVIVKRKNNLYAYKGDLIPYINLRERFSNETTFPEKEKLVIINKQNKRFAIITDEIIGQHQAVIKPLNKALQDIEFLSGASILGDGSIALLIDTEKLKYILASNPVIN